MNDQSKNASASKPNYTPGKQNQGEKCDPNSPEKGPRGSEPIEAPGRPGVEKDPQRDKAYGPGGARPIDSQKDSGHVSDMDKNRQTGKHEISAKGTVADDEDADEGRQNPSRQDRTGQGADTRPA